MLEWVDLVNSVEFIIVIRHIEGSRMHQTARALLGLSRTMGGGQGITAPSGAVPNNRLPQQCQSQSRYSHISLATRIYEIER